MNIRAYCEEDREGVIDVWTASNLTRSWNDPNKDIDRKLSVDPKGFLVAVESGHVVGTVMAGYEGHRGWIQYMAVHPDFQGSGYGKALIESAIELLRARGCPKVNLQVRRSNTAVVEFYKRVGFADDDVLSMGLRLIPDVPPT
jgi:ribosomal protein S18 acetylase RimI-like enzyme